MSGIRNGKPPAGPVYMKPDQLSHIRNTRIRKRKLFIHSSLIMWESVLIIPFITTYVKFITDICRLYTIINQK